MIINLSHCNFFFYTHVIQSMTARCCNIKQFIYLSISSSRIALQTAQALIKCSGNGNRVRAMFDPGGHKSFVTA